MKRFFSFSLLLITLLSSGLNAQDLDTYLQGVDGFFKTHVSNDLVDYKTISQSSGKLESLVDQAASIEVDVADANRYKAFWINTYNLLVIKGIIDHYPTASPLDVKGFFDKNKFKAGGKELTLNDIENKLLRAKFDDARIQFVLVCGALGCPPLIAEAYLPATIDQQVDRQTVKAVNDPNFIRVSKKKVALSEIFKWYKEDFVSGGKDEIDFLNTYLKQPLSEKTKITYYPYDWRLNAHN